MELDKQYKKAITSNNSLVTTKINDIQKTKIPAHQTQIDVLLGEIKKIETSLSNEHKQLESNISARLNTISSWKTTNKQASKNIITTHKKLVTSTKKSIIANQKKYTKLNKKRSKEYQQMAQSPQKLQNHLHSEVVLYNTLSAEYVEHLTHEYFVYLTQIKDAELDLAGVQETLHRNTDRTTISKELSMQTALIHRIHTKQLSALEKTSKKLTAVSKSHKLKLSKLKTRINNSKKVLLAIQKSYETMKSDYKKRISDIQTTNKKLKSQQKSIQNKIDLTEMKAQKNIKAHMISLITPEQKLTQDHIVSLQESIQNLEKSNIRLDIQIQETQKSAEMLWDTKRKKEVLAHEKQLHAQQVSLDSLQHHLDYELTHLELIQDSITHYTKDVAHLNKKITKAKKK